jgi:hypothetical protein
LFADYDEMRRHFKNLYFKVCQIPLASGHNDHQKTVVKFIKEHANANGWTPLHTAVGNSDLLTVLLILQYAKVRVIIVGKKVNKSP